MKLSKSMVLPSIVFLFLAITICMGWRSINAAHAVPNTSNKKKIKHTERSILSYQCESTYQQIKQFAPTLDSNVFKQAYVGYLNLREQGKTHSSIISIADLSIRSNQPRLWIIDLAQDSVLLNTFVAHGRGSGLVEAKTFSNRPNSNQSSLGFYLTGETYQGKHGRSLRLDGLDKDFNTNARSRGIVLHGAWYVGPNILKGQDRMGVSQGCPAVAEVLKDKIINLIKDQSVLYIHGQSTTYHSALLNEQVATDNLMASMETADMPSDSAALHERGDLL